MKHTDNRRKIVDPHGEMINVQMAEWELLELPYHAKLSIIGRIVATLVREEVNVHKGKLSYGPTLCASLYAVCGAAEIYIKKWKIQQ